MADKTPAQLEFDQLIASSASRPDDHIHPEDRLHAAREQDTSHYNAEDQDEEERYRASKVDQAMRVPSLADPRMAGVANGYNSGVMKLPPASFDSGRATGVKGVIADARSYENARRSKWSSRIRNARQSIFGGLNGVDASSGAAGQYRSDEDGNGSNTSDDESQTEERFLEQWRESRRRELESGEKNGQVRSRRTSPSVRLYGCMEDVDAMGYLDAIEKVGRDTTVVVFVYDHESQVSATIEAALRPLVRTYPAIRFVKVHYEEIEFDEAGVPALLGYRNQGDLIANLTAVLEMIPDDEDFDSGSLEKLFKTHGIM